MHHTVWTDESANIGQIKQVVQTADGFLWLKTATGRLLRFDGVRFEPIETAMAGAIPSGEHRWDDIYSIDAARDGGLWISHGVPRLDLLKDGRVQTYTPQNGLPNVSIDKILQGQDGDLWIATTAGLSRLRGSRCSAIGLDWGYTGGAPAAMLAARDGTLWVRSHDGRLFYLKPGSKTFDINISGLDVADYEGSMAQAPDGTIWQASPAGLRRVLQGDEDRPGSRPFLLDRHTGVTEMLFDQKGALWLVMADGLHFIPHPEQLAPPQSKPGRQPSTSPSPSPSRSLLTGRIAMQVFTTKQGLSSDLIWSLLEDREGNIWVGTGGGLDRFRTNTFLKAPLPATRQEQFAIASGDHGTVWASNWNSPLFHVGDRLLVSHQFDGNGISALYRDPAGTLWIGKKGQSLWHSTGGGFVSVGWPPGLEADYVKAMRTDSSGALWVSTGTQGIFRLANGIWTKQNHRLQIPDGAPVQAITTDDQGQMWFDTGTLTVLGRDKLQKFGPKDGVVRGYATVMVARGQHTWLGGVYGLALFMNGHFQVIAGTGDETFRGTTGIVELPDGDLWLNTISGVIHIQAAEAQKEIREPTYRVQFERLDALQGLEGSANYWIPIPTEILGSDGTLWFSTNRGVFSVDPKKIAQDRNPLPPPVFINSVTSGGKRFAILGDMKLPPHTQSMQIEYTALSLSIPERVNFRYLLEGVDREWQDAGTRRQAFYTSLSPGNHRFRVIACNNDGLWNDVGATLSFTIAPAYYQTRWFQLLCLAVLGLFLYLLYFLRLQQATAQIQQRLEARLEERERIARELHDTLLQSVQGLMLRFQAVMKMLPEREAARQMMEHALDRADDVLLEGRQRVRNLRAEGVTGMDLADTLASCGEELANNHPTAFSLTVVGTPETLEPIVCSEFYRIGREALINAFQHAKATKIEAELIFRAAGVRMVIRDDGQGIEPKILEDGRAGHWGLSGMRERAEKIGGRLSLWSRSGGGTEVDLTIPSRLAYAAGRDSSRWEQLKQRFSELRALKKQTKQP